MSPRPPASEAELIDELQRTAADLAGARELLAAIMEAAAADDDVNPYCRLGQITGAADAALAGPVYPGQNPYDMAAQVLRETLAKGREKHGVAL